MTILIVKDELDVDSFSNLLLLFEEGGTGSESTATLKS